MVARAVKGTLASTLVVGLSVLVASVSVTAQKNDDHDLTSLNSQVVVLYRQGNYAEATEIAKQALALAEKKFQSDNPKIFTTLYNLARLYQKLGYYSDAEALLIRGLGLREAEFGLDHSLVGAVVNDLASLYHDRGRYVDAEPLYRRALNLREKTQGPKHPDVGKSLNDLGELYLDQGRFADAEPLYNRSLKIFEKALGPDHLEVGTVLNNLARLHQKRGQYAEAELLHKRSLAIREKGFGSEHLTVGTSLNNLADLYAEQGRYAEAEPLFQRFLAICERALGSQHPLVGAVLNNLGVAQWKQGRSAEAEGLYKRSVETREMALGSEHPDVALSLNNLAELYQAEGRYSEAELLHKRALYIREKAFGPQHPAVGESLDSLAKLYTNLIRPDEAEPLFHRSIGLREKVFGPHHPEVAKSLGNLGLLYQYLGRYAEAKPLYERALTVNEKAFGPDHSEIGTLLYNLGTLHYSQRDWARSATYLKRSTAVAIRRVQRDAVSSRAASGVGRRETDRLSERFKMLVKTVQRVAPEAGSRGGQNASEMFVTAQWAHDSQAANALAQMAARTANGETGLSSFVRERQDLIAEWLRRDQARSAMVSLPPERRERQAEAINVTRLTEIDTRIAAIDMRLKAEFPDYAALATPEPLTVEQAQADLRSDEALVLFLDTTEVSPTPEETFIWVITKTDVRWVRSDLGTDAITREVAALRCGLDATSWHSDGAKRCAELLKLPPGTTPTDGAPLPFDHARAFALYKTLFGEVADLIKGKNLLLVPSGPLMQLPFQVLVTEQPKGEDHKAIRWLARDHALTVLPAVSSLKALRRIAKPSAATKPMIGFGNPLLDGNQSHSTYGKVYKQQAALARAHKGCAQAPAIVTAELRGLGRSTTPITQQSRVADQSEIRMLSPLPETADELCAVARDLNADVSEIRIGARATEREVKALSASGQLAKYRILHFATHGTLAGQLSGTNEPGLILTPPDNATEVDDGYLSAGEIAGLKLDADWVILSACNTAGGAGSGSAEALSGLARAFFYAQARALLVSHWEVDSDATVKLITSAVGATVNDKTVGRAEAHRRAMLAMIDSGKPHEAHPAYWAPFVVVGEGAAASK